MSNIYLEVDKSNQAILSYFSELPSTPSSTVDYVEATTEELSYLSALEDNVYPAGTVATLSDLTAFRDKRRAVAKAQAALIQSKLEMAKANAAVVTARANLSKFMDAEASKRGLTRTELEAALEARQRRLESIGNAGDNTVPTNSEQARSSLKTSIQQYRNRTRK